jgi:hypothetical protein
MCVDAWIIIARKVIRGAGNVLCCCPVLGLWPAFSSVSYRLESLSTEELVVASQMG